MSYSIPPTNQMDSVYIWASVFLFIFFACLVLIKQLAKGEDCYQKINKTHFYIFLPYLPIATIFALITHRLDFSFLIAISIGTFIYFSMHYIYFFALIGLVKKSISINILADAVSLSLDKKTVSQTQLLELQANKTNGITYIRNDRLVQMLVLSLANKNMERYSITKRGRFANYLRSTILKAWNLEQL